MYYHQPGVFDNLKHLVVVGPRFEEDQDQTISPFLSGLRNLRTLTLKLDDDNNGEVDANVGIIDSLAHVYLRMCFYPYTKHNVHYKPIFYQNSKHVCGLSHLKP